MQNRYVVAVHPSEGSGKRHFSRKDRAVEFAGRQAAAAWRVAAEWSIVDRVTSGRLLVDARGIITSTVTP